MLLSLSPPKGGAWRHAVVVLVYVRRSITVPGLCTNLVLGSVHVLRPLPCTCLAHRKPSRCCRGNGNSIGPVGLVPAARSATSVRCSRIRSAGRFLDAGAPRTSCLTRALALPSAMSCPVGSRGRSRRKRTAPRRCCISCKCHSPAGAPAKFVRRGCRCCIYSSGLPSCSPARHPC